ncbi:protein Aster-B-like isoform X2 [Boleophthalmus pectinirostris]|uniref:protein Aster-B-like isoform X2 n=1 Tax=Boleophthalmus pectinirostris TaxID=150288 RepID=UPI00242EF9D9|nr:protein Aster-B-like isoform X2 [Boleophthalmus pectinirostris]
MVMQGQSCHPRVSSLRKRLPFHRVKSDSGTRLSTATNSHRSTPVCSPVLRKRSRSSTPLHIPSAPDRSSSSSGSNTMVEKGSEQPSSDRSPTSAEQHQGPHPHHQRSYSQPVQPNHTHSHANSSGRTGGKNSKKSQSWYNVLSPTYKQRNEDFRKLFKQLPDTERLIVDYSCALQRDILLQGRLYLSENWICFYSNIFRWETLLMVQLKDICTMTKEKTARLIPNAIQLCTNNEKHFFTSFGARDRTYMMMFRLWQNALMEKPLCPKELWHFVHQCYGNELGLTSDDEDYVPPDEDFNTMGYCEELPVEENTEQNQETSQTPAKTPPDNHKSAETKADVSPTAPHTGFCSNNAPPDLPSNESPLPQYEAPPVDDVSSTVPEADPVTLSVPDHRPHQRSPLTPLAPPHVPLPTLDLNDNEDLPTELSDSSETHDEGEVQPFHEDLSGRQYMNCVYRLGVDKMYDLLFSESDFMRDFLERRRFSDVVHRPWRKDPDGNQTRELMYSIVLNNPLVPKAATVTETQTLYKGSQENECYVIDTEVNAHDVPYHDYFYTVNRYVLTRVAKNKCRLRVSTELRYRKQPWGLVKTFIERSFRSGLDEYFRHLELELNKLELLLLDAHSPSSPGKGMRSGRRRRRTFSHHLRPAGSVDRAMGAVTTPEEEDEDMHLIKHVAGSTQTRHLSDSTGGLALYSFSKILLFISLVLILLIFLHLMLFYKLWMLEYTTSSLTTSHGLRPQESKAPQTQMEWVQLLDSQQRFHDTELHKWKEIIKSSVILLDQLRDSLVTLHKNMGFRDSSSSQSQKKAQYPH